MKNIIETMRKQGFSDEAIRHVISRGNIIEGWEPGRSMGEQFRVLEIINLL